MEELASQGIVPLQELILRPQAALERANVIHVQDLPKAEIKRQMLYPKMSSSFFGRGKFRFYYQPIDKTAGSICEYGEDRVVKHTSLVVSKPDALASFTAELDGHGVNGDKAAHGAAVKLIEELQNRVDELLSVIDKEQEFQKIWNEIFAALEQNHIDKFPSEGGTTVTIFFFSTVDGVTRVSCINVGDSEAILVDNKTGKVREMSVSHNWDDQVLRREYLAHCEAIGSEPAEVVFGRMNLPGGTSLKYADQTPFNDGKPVFIYKPKSAELHRENICSFNEFIAHRFKKSIGGSQSLRRYMLVHTKDPEQKAVQVDPEHAHMNWGSTPLFLDESGQKRGGPQMYKSIGDTYFKKKVCMMFEPSVNTVILDASEDVSAIVFSDGIGDLNWLAQLGLDVVNYIAKDMTEDEMAQAILQKTITNAVVSTYGRITPLPSQPPRPNWDDISGSIVRIRSEDREKEKS
jgi:serine/threonine protein phosphatase PrpC